MPKRKAAAETPLNKKPAFKPSAEQQRVIEYSNLDKCNVVVTANPGSGKTTLAFAIIRSTPDATRTCIITYSRNLSDETKERKEKEENRDIASKFDVYTLHAMAVEMYSAKGFDDQMLETIVQEDTPIRPCKLHDPRKKYGRFIVDEFQDFTLLYFRFLVKLIHDLGEPIQLIVLGDVRQNIFKYRGSDKRFILLFEDVFREWTCLVNKTQFVHLTLSSSFRLSPPMCAFFNKCLLPPDTPIRSGKRGSFPPVNYIHEHEVSRIVDLLIAAIDRDVKAGIHISKIFIIAPSIENCFLITEIVNRLAIHFETYGWNIFIPPSETRTYSVNVTINKLRIQTQHQSKGQEAEIAIVLGFSDSYFNFRIDQSDRALLVDPFWVAMTRGSYRLILVHRQEDKLPQTLAEMEKMFQEGKGCKMKCLNNVSYLPPPIEEKNTFLERLCHPDDKEQFPLYYHPSPKCLLPCNAFVKEENTRDIKYEVSKLAQQVHPRILHELRVLVEPLLIEEEQDKEDQKEEQEEQEDQEEQEEQEQEEQDQEEEDQEEQEEQEEQQDQEEQDQEEEEQKQKQQRQHEDHEVIAVDSEVPHQYGDLIITEEVSDLTGIALPRIFEDFMHHEYVNNGIYDESTSTPSQRRKRKTSEALIRMSCFRSTDSKAKAKLQNWHHELYRVQVCPETGRFTYPRDYLFHANLDYFLRSKRLHRLGQIKSYSWLTDESIDKAIDRLQRRTWGEFMVNPLANDFERTISIRPHSTQHDVTPAIAESSRLYGAAIAKHQDREIYLGAEIDYLSSQNIWEFKFVAELSMEHKLQSLVYLFIYWTLYPDQRHIGVKLFNIRNNTLWMLNDALGREKIYSQLCKMMELLIDSKLYDGEEGISDAEFVERCRRFHVIN